MAEDDHKLVKYIEDFTGADGAEPIMRRKFALMDDANRTKELQNISSWLNDPAASVRQKSQIADLGRKLNELHQAMRKVGR